MAVTALQGIFVVSGSGDLEIAGTTLSGSGAPVAPPSNQALTWFYQDNDSGTLYRWNVPSLAWEGVANTRDIPSAVMRYEAVYANMVAGSWRTVYDDDLLGFANTDIANINTFEIISGYKYPVTMDIRQDVSTGVVEARPSVAGTYRFEFILIKVA